MNISEIIEHEDGSATIMFEMSNDEVKQLLESAIIIGLTEGIKLKEQQNVQTVSATNSVSCGANGTCNCRGS